MVGSINFLIAAQRKKITSWHKSDAFRISEPSSRDESKAIIVEMYLTRRFAALNDARSMKVREKREGRIGKLFI